MRNGQDLDEEKKKFATTKQTTFTLADAMKDADVFIGLSVGNVVTEEMVKGYGKKPDRFCNGKS